MEARISARVSSSISSTPYSYSFSQCDTYHLSGLPGQKLSGLVLSKLTFQVCTLMPAFYVGSKLRPSLLEHRASTISHCVITPAFTHS